MTTGRLAGRTAIVTGAAAGIGRAIAERFCAEGARVIAADLNIDALADLKSAHETLAIVEADVATASGAIAIANAAGPHVDILVNNAGIYPTAAFEDITYEEWRRVIAVNLDSLFLVTRAVLPLMRDNGWGRIINIGSSSFFAGTPQSTHYIAAKGGVIGFSRSLASELGAYGITVNVVAPGLTSTQTILDAGNSEIIEMRRKQRPISRYQDAADVVGAVLFLASIDADFITGQTINVDGGIIKH
jgi:NAD(P)-dependent dehydrogenase (short-subunit alcohol dehydrogenase family)